jgi:hypothetical protein
MTGRDGGADLTPLGNAPVVVLVRPQLADNIGAVARAMGNGGLFLDFEMERGADGAARDGDLQRLPLLRGLLRGLPGDDAQARVHRRGPELFR